MIDNDKRLAVRNNGENHTRHTPSRSPLPKVQWTARTWIRSSRHGRVSKDGHSDALLRVRIPAESDLSTRPARLRLVPRESLAHGVACAFSARRPNYQHFDNATPRSIGCRSEAAECKLRLQTADSVIRTNHAAVQKLNKPCAGRNDYYSADCRF